VVLKDLEIIKNIEFLEEMDTLQELVDVLDRRSNLKGLTWCSREAWGS
jgi:hypothetical protein